MCQILGPPGIAYRHWSYLRTGVASTFFYRGRVLLEYIYIYIYMLYCLPYFDDLVKDDSDALQHYPHISVGWDWMANTNTFQSATFRMFQRGNRIFQRPLPLNPTDLLIHFFDIKFLSLMAIDLFPNTTASLSAFTYIIYQNGSTNPDAFQHLPLP